VGASRRKGTMLKIGGSQGGGGGEGRMAPHKQVVTKPISLGAGSARRGAEQRKPANRTLPPVSLFLFSELFIVA